MKNLLTQLLFGKDIKSSGLIAFGIITLIALGCTCNKDLGLSKDSANTDNSGRTSSNSKDTPFGDKEDSDGTLPPFETIGTMVKETTEDFAKAIDSEDFSEIYEKSSTDFQSTYTEEQMKDVFKSFITQKRRVLPSLNNALTADVRFEPVPAIRTEKGLNILVATGNFKSKPNAVKFEYEYVYRGGEWKMLKLVVKM